MSIIDEFIQLIGRRDKTIKITYSDDVQTVCNYLNLNINTSNKILKNCYILPIVKVAINKTNIDGFLDLISNDTSNNYKYVVLPGTGKLGAYTLAIGKILDYMMIFNESLEQSILKSYDAKKLSNLNGFW